MHGPRNFAKSDVLPAQLVWAAENETLKNYGVNALGSSSSVAEVWRGVAGIDREGANFSSPYESMLQGEFYTSPLPVCKGGTGEILTNRCPWGGSAGWCAQTAPTLLLPLPTARICVR